MSISGLWTDGGNTTITNTTNKPLTPEKIMSHLISIELDSDCAKSILDCLNKGKRINPAEKTDLIYAISESLSIDDAEEDEED